MAQTTCPDCRVYRLHIRRWLVLVIRGEWAKLSAMVTLAEALLERMPEPVEAPRG